VKIIRSDVWRDPRVHYAYFMNTRPNTSENAVYLEVITPACCRGDYFQINSVFTQMYTNQKHVNINESVSKREGKAACVSNLGSWCILVVVHLKRYI